MKIILAGLFCLLNLYSFSQETQYVNDTIITTTGFKVYEGVKLKLGMGSMPDGSFKFIRINQSSLFAYNSNVNNRANSANAAAPSHANHTVEVARTEKRGSKKVGYTYYAILKMGEASRYECDIESAIAAGEVVVPNEFKPKTNIATQTPTISVADELVKLKKLLDAGAITQEEYDTAKKKLLDKF
ncbi:MAG: SHOCT domain-containing protein [Bacteroidetes bacterium]|nr:SHOCT domain-containing protein [Bacteroidota bacterium]MBS1671946.1 SHOCT domain-containing protein [Bacteroidota bacterium]